MTEEEEAEKLLNEAEGFVMQARGKLHDFFALKRKMVKQCQKAETP
jgi:hypothetical protein